MNLPWIQRLEWSLSIPKYIQAEQATSFRVWVWAWEHEPTVLEKFNTGFSVFLFLFGINVHVDSYNLERCTPFVIL